MKARPSAAARDWLADHLHAFVWMLLALWVPPIVFTMLVDVHIVGGAGSGYPALRDPGLLLDAMQIILMAAALPMLRVDRARAWQLLCGALVVWSLHDAWVIQGRLRLVGRHDLLSRETLIAAASLAVASLVMLSVRDRLLRDAPIALPTTGLRPAGQRLDTT